MDIQTMLKHMCEDDLADADIKAICKSRGFPVKEATSRDVFENFFISTIGIKEALDSLTYEEVVFLHLFNKINTEVNIACFERLYGSAKSEDKYYYGTFNQRYKETFNKAKSNLVRKGVLLFREKEGSRYQTTTKLERLRFRFPPEFADFLPPVARASKFTQAGNFKKKVQRDKLLEIIGGKQKSSPLSTSEQQSFTLTIKNGNLFSGNKKFKASHLLKWQQACWHASIKKTDTNDANDINDIYNSYSINRHSNDVDPIEVVIYTFSQLKEHEWLPADSLAVIFKIFKCKVEDKNCEQICEAGWEWGNLKKVVVDGKTYYRLPENCMGDTTSVSPKQYLQVKPDGTVILDLVITPPIALEVLALVATLDIHDSKLRASASIIKIGNELTTVRKESVFIWLRENSSDFRTVIEIAEKRWGKQIIHEGLMVAQVKDLSLKVQIEKKYAGSKSFVSLPNDYIAFSYDLLPDVQTLVEASGHVVKKARYK